MNVLITGGDGFIGSHMVMQLLAEGHNVRVIEPISSRDARRIGSLSEKIEWCMGDCGDYDFSRQACDGIDLVYHFASSTNPATTWDDPVREVREGILRSVSFLEAAAEAGVPRFSFSSSGGTVYGRSLDQLVEGSELKPVSPHGIGKYAVELFAGAISQRTSMQIDIYRISNPYGPFQFGEAKQGVCAVWMDRILKGKSINVFGDDQTKRDYIYVKDACQLMAHSLRDSDSGGTYNISSGEMVSTLELLALFKEIIPTAFDYEVEPRRQFDNVTTNLDNSLILEIYQDFEFKKMKDGLNEMWNWYSVQSQSAGSA